MSRKRASESQFDSETHSKKIHKTSSEAGGGVSDIIIDDNDEGQVEFCTSFSSKEELARTFEHAVKVAVKSVMSEMTKLVDSKYLVFQVRMDGKEKDIESLKLRIEKAEDELKTIRECLNADKDVSSRALVNTSRLSEKEKLNTLETRVSALSRKLKDPASMNSTAPFQKQYSVHSTAAPVHKKVQSAQVLMHPDKAAANSNLFTRVRDCVQIANLRIRHEAEGERSLKGAGMKTIELDRMKDVTLETLHNKKKCAEIPKGVTEQTRDSRKRKTFVDPMEGGTVGTGPARIPKEVTKQTPTPVTEADPQHGSSLYKVNAPEAHSVCVKEEPAGLETVHIKDEPAGLETVQIKDERAGLETVHIVEEPAGLEAVQIKEEVPEFEPVNIKEEATELDSLHIIEVPEVNESDPGGPYEDQRQVEDDRTDKATQKQTKWAIKIFKDWLASQNISTQFETFTPTELNKHLYNFYPSVRKTDGKEYGKSALIGLRASINRYLRELPCSSLYCLMTDREFSASNQMLVGLLKREHFDVVHHRQALEKEDFEKMIKSKTIGNHHPLALQRLVWVSLVLHFTLRGAKTLRSMTKSTFKVVVDNQNRECLELAVSPKPMGADHKERPGYRICGLPGNPMCPVAAFKLYVEKLSPENECFWQRPKQKDWHPSLLAWYESQPVGVNKLKIMMQEISRDAALSRPYTNHCLRATPAHLLKRHALKTNLPAYPWQTRPSTFHST
ncbi:hypothetical protein AOXY_G28498 [Acipenser oxyrinchus oxyrinchus]|uniref:DUF3504 domain-containing protein n=1 Tax=Acipenser oxyrinchus oxyrinchus TaxID=40147 RepID=A0AAD8CN30_ACIOX|nr:hypothetical protein AOXY_G28498 [Acipenser oxyrinchus oxyrinchus]